MARFIVYEFATGRIVNAVEWDGVSDWRPPARHDIFKTNEGNVGDTFDPLTGKVTPAPPATKTRAQVLAEKGLTRADFEDAMLTNNAAEIARQRVEYANVKSQFPDDKGL